MTAPNRLQPQPSREACGDCWRLQVYSCPCQAPTCRARTWPGSRDCQVQRADQAEIEAARDAAAAGPGRG